MVNEIANGDDLLIREDEAKYFGYGMNAYYYHIMQLFDLQNVPSFVAEFAEVCSQFVSPVANDDVSDADDDLMFCANDRQVCQEAPSRPSQSSFRCIR